MTPLLVFVGGGLGAVARYAFGVGFLRAVGTARPWTATFCVNVLGGLAMGVLAAWLSHKGAAGAAAERLRLLLGVGLLGGFTTFSTFSLEVAGLLQRRAWAEGLGYAAASAVFCVLAVFAGLALGRRAFG
jgi:fluoride exporter